MGRQIKIRICICLILCSFLISITEAQAQGSKFLFWRKNPALSAPHAVPAGGLVPPAGENSVFPVRDDGQQYLLNIDTTVNMTSTLNEFYYNPSWRGEVWVPFDQFTLIEKATRKMATWREYDEFSELRVFNIWHKFWERLSGFGP